MQRFRKAALTLPLAMSLLSACALTKTPQAPVVLNESQPAHLKAGTPTPFDGWLLSDASLAKLLEAAEACKNK